MITPKHYELELVVPKISFVETIDLLSGATAFWYIRLTQVKTPATYGLIWP
jgi:hypothetical protein